METKETILNQIFRNDPRGILGEKTMPIESKELLIRNISFALNSGAWRMLEDCLFVEDALSTIKMNPDSEIWSEIEEFIADKILEDNEITIVE